MLKKVIEGFENYSVDVVGNVRNEKTGKYKTLSLNYKGYLTVLLHKNGKATTRFAHRLAAKAFLPNPENKPQVNHINNIRTDNRLENLEWCTAKENVFHSMKQGRMVVPSMYGNFKGSRHPLAKLTEEHVWVIKQLLSGSSLLQREIGLLFGVSTAVIGGIKNKKSWTHV